MKGERFMTDKITIEIGVDQPCACCAKRLQETIDLEHEVLDLQISLAWYARQHALSATVQAAQKSSS
jgi:hypothetical protein